ncbi:MAG: xanthine dehydrogenase molybdopterin binding subunit [Ignavibacteriae bacterium]|nr:xanthine dehydrogenase molybdopterin binding subunit [Ignavibacteria bacterium]MBI3363445.1 xanthine dehydrogenase molybdopterin binding subunit [Ignavibacteriota bacterium]
MKENSIPHESAIKHVTGEAVYVDDIEVSDQLLVGRVVYSPHAHAKIKAFDLFEAKKIPGVHAVLSHKDIPGHNQMGPVVKDEPCLAENEVVCVGQAMFLIAAETEEQALEAEKLIKVEFEELESILTLEQAIEQKSLLGPPAKIERGNVDDTLRNTPHVIRGELRTGAQEHWYLESQVALCIPGEGREMIVYSSTQHPSETQALIAELLGVGKNEVVVEVRRMGGAFGGKETQANHTACWTALLAWATKQPVKIRLFRDDDMKITGKRHRFLSTYDVGFDDEGNILAANVELNSDGGCTTDLSFAILQRAMLHADNAYYIPNMRVVGKVYKTNLPSNTAFRGFGGPQGMAVIEQVLDRVARYLKKDASEIRLKNFYGLNDRNVTHYGQAIEHNRLLMIHEQLMQSSQYSRRRKRINEFNTANEFSKKGLAITPVKFGISFTTSFLNQAAALVLIYKDGTILVNHGGTEMGQGLHTKMQQVTAAEFGVSIDRVKVNATNTSKIPNTSATAASAGSDLNGMAVKNAVDILKGRIAEVIAQIFTERHASSEHPTSHIPHPSTPRSIIFENDFIVDSDHPERRISFAEAMPLLHLRQVPLSATGFYKTPGIGWDKEKGFGKPFYYFAFGMAVTEVLLDILTGRHTILRTDILHDVGDSLNPGIDIGQVEGGYIQGIGWCTTEEIKWDEKGNLMTHSPDTYKIPSVQDIPKDFRVALLQGVPNPDTIRRSKAVAEPPLMLSLSCWLAIKDAISAVANHEIEPEFSLPATNETILLSIARLRECLARRSVPVATINEK